MVCTLGTFWEGQRVVTCCPRGFVLFYSMCRTAAACSQSCMVLLLFLNFVRLCPGMSWRSVRQAFFIICTVQCFLGLPTRLVRESRGFALGPLNVAFLVGAVVGSLSMCMSSLCCASLICCDMLGIMVWPFLASSFMAASSLTLLLVFAMYVSRVHA